MLPKWSGVEIVTSSITFEITSRTRFVPASRKSRRFSALWNRSRLRVLVGGLVILGGLMITVPGEVQADGSPYLTPSRHRQSVSTVYVKTSPAPIVVPYTWCAPAGRIVYQPLYGWLYNRHIQLSKPIFRR